MRIFQIFDKKRFTIYFCFFLLIVNQPIRGSGILHGDPVSKEPNNPIKADYLGEIVGYSYIKISLESTSGASSYRSVITPIKGTCFEAVSGKNFKVFGSYNNETFLWKLDCFDKSNSYISTFLGKEDSDGNIQGKWSLKKVSYTFYLKKISK